MQLAPNPLVLLAIFGFLIAMFLLFTLSFRLMIRAALRKFIKPDFENNGLILLEYKSVGLWGYGDFKPKDLGLTFITSNGSPFVDIYLYLYFKTKANEAREHVTVKIETAFMIVRKVVYSKSLDCFRN